MTKKIIVYYPFQLKTGDSGSGVRPTQMLKAFHELAYEQGFECLDVIGDAKERKNQLRKIYEEVNPDDILYCYMENQTIPIWLTDPDHIPRHPLVDHSFFKFLKKNKIPLGIFYRDIYWKFKDLYKVKPIIKTIMVQLFEIELFLYKKNAKKIFLPSLEMNKYVKIPSQQVSSSPPGGIDRTAVINKQDSKKVRAVYVGGIDPRYGVYEVLEAFKQLNKGTTYIELLFVCREKEFNTFKEYLKPYLNEDWLHIHHAHGEALLPIYKDADFGIVTLKRGTYNDFAVPVKLFEYLSYGLPVLATDCTALQKIVEQDKIGLIVKDNSDSIQGGLKEMLDSTKRNMLRQNSIFALKRKHLWFQRAKDIQNELLS
ncbi:glycosyltransferase [Fredinandcohnia salidurans]|uniref:Glycosyltransferase n=1 Tax=Fredinandcohnia salidurans TaxID=2595041 RepID=A0ABW4MPX6_9BACI|nr:glycosyltransferase [Fredinandcohnia onubensis]